MRTIRTTGTERSQAVADAIEGVLIAELLDPSTAIWLVSPWVSDIPVIENSDGRYSGLALLPRRPVSLIEVLERLSRANAELTVVARDDPSNVAVITRLRELCEKSQSTHLVLTENVHDKTLLTDRVLLSGSMNFTYGGTERNTESLTVVDDPEAVNSAHIQLRRLYRQR